MPFAARYLAIAVFLVGCSESGVEIARDVRADSVATTLRVTPTIRAHAGPRALCLEFQPPGHSHRVADLTMVLTDSLGGLDTLRGRLDRTGESTVCVRDSIAVARTFVALSVRAASPLPIHRILWSSPRDSVRATER